MLYGAHFLACMATTLLNGLAIVSYSVLPVLSDWPQMAIYVATTNMLATSTAVHLLRAGGRKGATGPFALGPWPQQHCQKYRNTLIVQSP